MKNASKQIIDSLDESLSKSTNQIKFNKIKKAIKNNDRKFLEDFFKINLDNPRKFNDVKKDEYFASMLWGEEGNKKNFIGSFSLLGLSAFNEQYGLFENFLNWADLYKDENKKWSNIMTIFVKNAFQKDDIKMINILEDFFFKKGDNLENHLPEKSVLAYYLKCTKKDFEDKVKKNKLNEKSGFYPIEIFNKYIVCSKENKIENSIIDFFKNNSLFRNIDFESELKEILDTNARIYGLYNQTNYDNQDKIQIKIPEKIKNNWRDYSFFYFLGSMSMEISNNKHLKHSDNVSFLYDCLIKATEDKSNWLKRKEELIEHHLEILLGEILFDDKIDNDRLKYDRKIDFWKQKRFKNIICGYSDYFESNNYTIKNHIHLLGKIDQDFILKNIVSKKNYSIEYEEDEATKFVNFFSKKKGGNNQGKPSYSFSEFIWQSSINQFFQKDSRSYKNQRLPLSLLFELLNYKKIANAIKFSPYLKTKHDEFIKNYPVILLHGSNINLAQEFVDRFSSEFLDINPTDHFFVYNGISQIDEENKYQFKDFVKLIYQNNPDSKNQSFIKPGSFDFKEVSLDDMLSSEVGNELKKEVECEILQQNTQIKRAKKHFSGIL